MGTAVIVTPELEGMERSVVVGRQERNGTQCSCRTSRMNGT